MNCMIPWVLMMDCVILWGQNRGSLLDDIVLFYPERIEYTVSYVKTWDIHLYNIWLDAESKSTSWMYHSHCTKMHVVSVTEIFILFVLPYLWPKTQVSEKNTYINITQWYGWYCQQGLYHWNRNQKLHRVRVTLDHGIVQQKNYSAYSTFPVGWPMAKCKMGTSTCVQGGAGREDIWFRWWDLYH